MKSELHPVRVALVEFDSSHDECLHLQIEALKSRNCEVILVTNELLWNRNPSWEEVVDRWINVDENRVGLTGNGIKDALLIRKIMRTLKGLNVSKIVFNTAQGGHVRNACLFSLFSKIEFIGIIHTARKFQESTTQKIIHFKIKKYFLLAKFLKEKVTPPNGIRIDHFYPLVSPLNNEHSLPSDENLNITIIGGVERRRKDLKGLQSLLSQSPKFARFTFLGKSDSNDPDVQELKKHVMNSGNDHRVQFYSKMISFVEFDQILRKSDVILPLVHPKTPSADQYFCNQIPGAMINALSYSIPLLIHEEYEKIEELNPASIYYTLDNFETKLNEIRSKKEAIRSLMKEHSDYQKATQIGRYLTLIFET